MPLRWNWLEDPTLFSLARLRSALAAGELASNEVVAAHRRKAAADRLNAFTEITTDPSPAAGPLAGVPVAVKDVFVDRDRPPTMGSRVRPQGMSGTATVLRRLRDEGATVLGYTNLHEWGLGTTSVTTATGPIRNPWDTDRIAGGSSGGSAAAVAAGIVPVAVGTDAGGSVRIPAACCGIVGLKPTFGAIPLEGDVAATSPVNHVGTLARNVADAAFLFEILVGHRLETARTEHLVVGVPENFFFENVQAEIAEKVHQAVGLMAGAVRDVRSVAVRGIEDSADAISRSLLPHTARLLAVDLAERSDDFAPRTLKTLHRGVVLGSQEVDLRRFRGAWDDAFGSCDVVAVPTLPAIPPLLTEHKIQLPSGPAVADLAQLALNAPMNTGGVPALTLPCGEVDGLAVGVTLVGRWNEEDVLVAAGRLLEELLDGAYRDRVAPDSDD